MTQLPRMGRISGKRRRFQGAVIVGAGLLGLIIANGKVVRADSPHDVDVACQEVAKEDVTRGAVVKGTVRLEGVAPKPREHVLDALMAQAMGQKTYRDETYLVDERGGLKNCVITLTLQDAAAKDATAQGAKPKSPPPLDKVFYDRDGVRYEPRVLVVAPDTEIVLRNKASVCRGFHIRSSRHSDNVSNQMIFEGQERSVRLKGPDECSVTCDVRPYALGYILVVNTPHFAVTDALGQFTIRNVPPGKYRLKVWHEAARGKTVATGPVEVVVADEPIDKQSIALELSVRAPAE